MGLRNVQSVELGIPPLGDPRDQAPVPPLLLAPARILGRGTGHRNAANALTPHQRLSLARGRLPAP